MTRSHRTTAEPAASLPHPLTDPNLRAIFGVTLIAVLGVSSITPAFPEIADALELTPHAVGLLVAVFTLPGIVLAPLGGILADRYGRKAILIPSLVLFALAGAACGLAKSFPLLLGLRAVQGIGAASLGVLNVTLIGDLFADWRRAAAMGYNASVLSVGTALYPAIGGALALLGWAYPFVLALLALPVAWVVWRRLSPPDPPAMPDLGVYLRTAATGLRDRRALALFAASLGAFVILYGAYLTYLPFLLRQAFGASSLLIGLVMSATSLATAVTAFRLGTLARRFTERRLVLAGFVLYAIAMVGLALAPTLGLLLVPIAIYGVGNGITIPSILTMLTGLARPEFRAAFMSVNGMVLRTGQTLGPLIVGAMLSAGGLVGAYLGSAGVAVVVLVLLAAVLRPGPTHS